MLLCKCGCGNEIIITKCHRYNPITRNIIDQHQQGRKHTGETRRKMSLAGKGKPKTDEWKKKIASSNMGKIRSEETRRKIGEAKKGKVLSTEHKMKISKANKGKDNHAWKGGISFYPYSIEFNNVLKGRIRNRDNNICQLCGKTEEENKRKLTPHHINYIKTDCNDENLITLCTSCNGKVNFNRGFWTGFFTCYIAFRIKYDY